MTGIDVSELAACQEGMTEQQKMLFLTQYNGEKKDRSIALIFSILLGKLGIDRFYVGDIAIGLIKLLTAGGCLIWWFVDWFLIMARVDELNRQTAHRIATAIKAGSQTTEVGRDSGVGSHGR